MYTFFHGWRQKAGCVVLVMALAIMAGWIRSNVLTDVVTVTALRRTYSLVSSQSQISMWVADAGHVRYPWWISSTASLQKWTFAHDQGGNTIFVVRSPTSPRIWRSVPVVAHYSRVTISLTLLSACLILWKPRKRMKRDA